MHTDSRRSTARRLRHVASFPIIWSILLVVIVADIWLELYHRSCFALYSIPYIKRSSYIRIDRHKLSKLNLYQKLCCMYCGYVNGWTRYASAIAASTENYWCDIQHENTPTYTRPKYQEHFQPRSRFK